MGFTTRYGGQCWAESAHRPQTTAPMLATNWALLRSLGVLFRGVCQAHRARADSLAAYLSLFPFHSRLSRAPPSETTCEGC